MAAAAAAAARGRRYQWYSEPRGEDVNGRELPRKIGILPSTKKHISTPTFDSDIKRTWKYIQPGQLCAAKKRTSARLAFKRLSSKFGKFLEIPQQRRPPLD